MYMCCVCTEAALIACALSWLSDNAVSAGVHNIQEAFVNKLSLIKFSTKEEGST